jgi:hypothetical protein
VFVIKLFIISNVQGGAWFGADGENYLMAYAAILDDGIFSSNTLLHYWPAGYPIFIYALSLIGQSFVLTTISVVQSLLYSYAALLIGSSFLKTKFKKFSVLVFAFILLNPTLSLASIVVGYESLVASGLLISVSLILNSLIDQNRKLVLRNIILVSLISGFISFFQPRLLLSSFACIAIWIFFLAEKKSKFRYLGIALIIISISPAALIFRNNQANGFNAISTNLGVTMNLGSGDDATGAYMKEGFGVPCTAIVGNPAEQDSHLVGCVIEWYLENPVKGAELVFNKAKFFWSPWYGPEASGSMGRNPWLKVSPFRQMETNSVEAASLIFGTVGKAISVAWVLGGLFFLFFGFYTIWKFGGAERVFAVIILTQISLNWLVAIGTLGDHRQRLPIMGLSLILQAVGVRRVFMNRKDLLVDSTPLR